MIIISRTALRALGLSVVSALVLTAILPAMTVVALSGTSLLLSDPRPSQTSSYTFDSAGFTTATAVRCIDLLLNDQPDGLGTAVGTTTSFTLDSSSIFTAGAWTEDTSTNGRLRITNAAGEVPSGATGNLFFGNVTNGATEGTTYYGIFTSYTDASCTGGNEVDQATVAYIFKDGELVQLTIDPTLAFTCTAVASGQSVNGVTTTTASTAAGINHGSAVTFAANGISAHDINVSTNATNGYTVYVRHTAQLTSVGGDTIANHTGTNATPTTFAAAGTEAWGYTTEDSSLTGGTADRFTNGGPFWAGFTTTNAPIIDNTAATAGTETTRVGHQVGVAATTAAGTYQTTIVYTVASVY